MYDFGNVNDVEVDEFIFKKGLVHLGMAISDGKDNPRERNIVFLPGFSLNDIGQVIPRRDDTGVFPPDKVHVENQIIALMRSQTMKPNDKVVLCINEETEQIAMAVVPNKKWYPVFSVI